MLTDLLDILTVYKMNQLVQTEVGNDSRYCKGMVDGRQCRRYPIKGRDFCAKHGGKTLIAHEHPAFRTGLTSINRKRFSNLGKQLLSRIEELREDPELWSLKDDAAYMTALIDMRAEAASEGFGVEVLRELQAEYSACKRAYRSGDIDIFQEHFESLGKLLNDGGDEAKATNEVIDLISKRVAIVEAEQRVTHAKAYTLEVDQAYSLVMQVVQIVKQCVRNADELTAIRSGVGKLLRTYKDQEQDVQDAEVVSETVIRKNEPDTTQFS